MSQLWWGAMKLKLADNLHRDLSNEEVLQLTDKERALWLSRPTRADMDRARHFMYLRVGLLIAGLLRLMAIGGGSGLERFLLFLLFAYEFAYYQLRKEQVQKKYWDAFFEYEREAKALNE